MTKKNSIKADNVLTEDEKSKDIVALVQASIEKAGEAIFWIDKDARFVNVNEAGCKHLGYAKNELLTLTVFDTDPNFPKEKWSDHWEELKEKVSLSFETFHRHKSGRIFPAEVRLNYIKLNDNEYNFAYAKDITERKKKERKQKESEAKYRDLVEMTSDWIWEVDENAVYTYISPKIRDILGYEPEEILGKTPFDLMPREERARVRGLFVPIAATQKPFKELENTNFHKDGHEVILETSGVPIFDADGKFHGYRGIDRDITNRKKVEEVIRFTQFAMDNAADALFWMSKDAKIIYVNHAASNMLGYTSEELTTMYTHDINPNHPPEAWYEHWKEVRDHGSFTFESTLKTKDGRIIPVETTANHIVFDNKEYNCAFTRDITERNNITIELQSYNAILHSLIDSTDDATLISDKDALPVLWNKAYARIMKEALNIDMRKGLQPHKQLTDEKSIAWWDDLHKRVLSGERFRTEYSHDFGTDDIRHYEISYNPIFEDGEVSGFSEFTRDITARKKAMKMIEISENKHRTLLNNIPQKIFYKDINSVYILCNESYAKDLNIEPSEIIGKTDYDFYSNELAEKYRTDDREIMESCKKLEIEEIYYVDGKEMTVNTLKAPLLDETGKTIGILGIFWDITERKKAENELLKVHSELEKRVQERTADLEKANKELQIEIENHMKTEKSLIENEKRFRAAATTTADLIWEGDTRENILNWHGDIDSILGYEDGEFPRTIAGHMDNIHPDDRDSLIKAVEKAIETGEDFFAEYRIKCKNGDHRYWDERGRAIGFENGRAVKWVGSVTDITEHRLSQDLLVKNEDKFRKLSNEFHILLDAIPDSLILLSPDMKMLWSNKAFDSQLKTQCSDSRGQICYHLCCDRTSPCENCPVIKSFRSGREESTRVVDSEGRVLDKRAFPMLDKSGNVINVIEVSRDITARMRMKEEARLVQSRLIHANKMTSLGTLVSGVAHEINNPNSYIMSNAQVFSEIWSDAVKILRENHNDKKNLVLGGIPFDELIQLAPRLLGGINEGSVRINKIIQSLKNFARPDKSSLDGKVDIKNVIMSSRTILDNHINKFTNNFHLDIKNNIPVIRGSSQQIEQVIINLIMNALQALTDKKSEIRISAYFDEAHNDVVIKMKDNGRGMSDDIIQSVTEPFFTTRIEDGGTGLGLSISYAIIKDHNGIMVFESELGSGTTVTVTLPANN